MPSFITAAQLTSRYDWRWIAENIADDDEPAASQSAVEGSAVVADAIEDASDLVMGASAIGSRYTEADLTAYGGRLLTRLVADLTMGLILKRRARAVEDWQKIAAPYAEAMDYLEQLRRGERVFWAVPDVPEAGLPRTASTLPLPGINPPTFVQCASRYFGSSVAGRWGYWTGLPGCC
jgi:hypothetical protein